MEGWGVGTERKKARAFTVKIIPLSIEKGGLKQSKVWQAA